MQINSICERRFSTRHDLTNIDAFVIVGSDDLNGVVFNISRDGLGIKFDGNPCFTVGQKLSMTFFHDFKSYFHGEKKYVISFSAKIVRISYTENGVEIGVCLYDNDFIKYYDDVDATVFVNKFCTYRH